MVTVPMWCNPIAGRKVAGGMQTHKHTQELIHMHNWRVPDSEKLRMDLYPGDATLHPAVNSYCH